MVRLPTEDGRSLLTRQGSLLIVDDSEPLRDVMSRRLSQRGYVVSVAAGGPEAMALVEQHPFDLVLLDVEMPGMSGLEVLSRLRADRSDSKLPVIMVTSRSEGADIVEAFRLGANDYVTKPVDFPVAIARIATQVSRKWAFEDLRVSEERYALAVKGANDGLWDWNLVTDELYLSPRWKAMLGWQDAEVGDSPDVWFSRVHPEDIARVRDTLRDHIAGESGHYESEHRLLHRNGTFRWALARGAAVRNRGGRAIRLAGSLSDITDAKLADPLTGLPNRLLFLDLLERAIDRTERRKHGTFSLLVVGLDRFGVVSASLGPLIADRLLVAVARRLQTCLRSTDTITRDDGAFTLARLGGDEFTVLLDDVADASDAMRVAERLRRALEEPFEVDGQHVFTSATVGIALGNTGDERPDEVLRDAATALNRARAGGTVPCEIFDPAMRKRAVARLDIETALRSAIEHRAFEVHYQPIVSMRSGLITGFEALVRWRHPGRGLLLPGDFISIAEETGVVRDIDRLTLTESCRQMALWQKQFGASAPKVMCVNVSSKQLADADFTTGLEAVLEASQLPASSLKLEITESAFINDVAAAQRTLSRAQSMGIEWSLDDFGTGYASMSYLHHLQVDTLKVDRSFVSRIGADPGGLAMVKAIVTLAHDLGMDVVAEGVETAEQSAALQALACEYAQGFYFSRAVPAADAERLIASQPWQVSADEYKA